MTISPIPSYEGNLRLLLDMVSSSIFTAASPRRLITTFVCVGYADRLGAYGDAVARMCDKSGHRRKAFLLFVAQLVDTSRLPRKRQVKKYSALAIQRCAHPQMNNGIIQTIQYKELTYLVSQGR